MSCMIQNFRLFHVSNLSVRNFQIFLLMYTGSVRAARYTRRPFARGCEAGRDCAVSSDPVDDETADCDHLNNEWGDVLI